jgi:YfiH family protein
MIYKSDFEFIDFKEKNIEIYFSTGENSKSFNMNTEEGLNNIRKLESYFSVKKIGYCKQIHGKNVIIFNESDGIKEADAILTNKKNIAIGVFNADCVPIIIVDAKKKAVGAIHSGWRGTYEEVVIQSVNKMIECYQSDIKDLSFYIGPHIMKCCYEVDQNLIKKFSQKQLYKEQNINVGNNLSLQDCILKQLSSIGVEDKKIYKVNKCTYCNKELSLHSFRKSSGEYGRMFSFVIIR